MVTRSTREIVRGGIAACLVAATLSACSSGGGSGSGNELVLGCYPAAAGTNWNTLFTKYVEPAFKKEYNATISYVQGNSTDTIAKLQGERSNPQFDAICADTGPNVQAQQRGLLAANDPSTVTNLKYVKSYAKYSNNLGVTISSLAAGLAYNTKAFKEHGIPAPTSWNDLTDPRLKGHVVLTDLSNTQGIGMLVMLAKLHGGSESNIAPGFAEAAKVADNSFASTNNDDVSSYYQSGGAWMSLWTNSEELTFQQQSHFPVRFVYPTEGSVVIGQTIAAVKGAPHPKLAQDFINLMLSKPIQKAIANVCYLTPVVNNVKLGAAVAKKVGQGHKLVNLDWATINKNRDAWTQRWAQTVASHVQ